MSVLLRRGACALVLVIGCMTSANANQKFSKQGPLGGPTGIAFEDKPLGKVLKIIIRAGGFVDSIQTFWKTSAGV